MADQTEKQRIVVVDPGRTTCFVGEQLVIHSMGKARRLHDDSLVPLRDLGEFEPLINHTVNIAGHLQDLVDSIAVALTDEDNDPVKEMYNCSTALWSALQAANACFLLEGGATPSYRIWSTLYHVIEEAACQFDQFDHASHNLQTPDRHEALNANCRWITLNPVEAVVTLETLRTPTEHGIPFLWPLQHCDEVMLIAVQRDFYALLTATWRAVPVENRDRLRTAISVGFEVADAYEAEEVLKERDEKPHVLVMDKPKDIN